MVNWHQVVFVTFALLISKLSCSSENPRCHCYVSNVTRSSNESLCEPDYFIFPDIWEAPESQSELQLESVEEKQENKLILCCPTSPDKVRVDDKQFWWPNEIHRGLSRGVLNCHPASIPGIDSIRFLYYTNNNHDPDDFTEIFIGSRKSFRVSRFVRDAPVKIVIHGFMSSPFVGPARALRQAYAEIPALINIIAVHWEPLANMATATDSICYNIAAESTKLVGKRTAELIEFLVRENLTKLQNIHVLGHSLGAHAAGFSGKYMKIGKLPRITAFDPARPNFHEVKETERIHHTDAHFVDVIHTATKDWKLLGMLSLGFIPFPVGLQDPVGHADFYPNRGTNQPGCHVVRPTIPVLCSHSRSYMYYAESIIYHGGGRKQFLSRECRNHEEVENGDCSGGGIVPMGEYTPPNNSTRKLYFLLTNKQPPYVMDDDFQ